MEDVPKSWKKPAKRITQVSTIYSKHAEKMTKYNYM
jgi:hypothetical protein